MTHKMQKFYSRLVALLMLIMLVHYWQIARVVFSTHTNISHLKITALIIIYFGLNIAAIIGLFQLKSWRTLVACLAILFSTLFFSTSYIPFIDKFFAPSYRFYAMLAVNLIILLVVISLRKNRTKKK